MMFGFIGTILIAKVMTNKVIIVLDITETVMTEMVLTLLDILEMV